MQFDQDGVIVNCNEHFRKIIEVPREAILLKSVSLCPSTLSYPLLQSVPIEIMKIGLWTLILAHFRLVHSGFNSHFGLSPTPTRWDENVTINSADGDDF